MNPREQARQLLASLAELYQPKPVEDSPHWWYRGTHNFDRQAMVERVTFAVRKRPLKNHAALVSQRKVAIAFPWRGAKGRGRKVPAPSPERVFEVWQDVLTIEKVSIRFSVGLTKARELVIEGAQRAGFDWEVLLQETKEVRSMRMDEVQ